MSLNYLIWFILTHWIPYSGYQLISFEAVGTQDSFSDSHICQIARFCKRLKFMDLTHSKVGRAGLEYMFHLNAWHIESLILVNVDGIDDRILNLISQSCKELKHLDISIYAKEAQYTDVGLVEIAKSCTQLESLNCIGCHSVSDQSLNALAAHCPELKELDFSGAFLITNAGASHLFKSCVNLNNVSLSYCWRLTDEAFTIFKECDNCGKNLQQLSVGFCYQISDRLLESLMYLPNLKSVNLSNCANISLPTRYRLIERGIHIF